MKVSDIVNRALRLLNISQSGETSTANEANDFLAALNLMIGQWNAEKLFVFSILTEAFDLTPGTGLYTIGSGGNFNTTRPQKIEKALIRFTPTNLTAYDFNLTVVSNDQYQDVFMKNIQTNYPLYLYYNQTYPLGTIYLWPIPNATSKLVISQWKQFAAFTGLTQDIELPPGYETALAYNLAVEMMPEYGKGAGENDKMIVNKAYELKDAIMTINTELTPLKTDPALFTPRGFNILSGSYR